MESVALVVERIIYDNLFLSEGLREGLLSYHRTAVYILPEVQRRVPDARVENVSVILQRMSKKLNKIKKEKYKIGKIKLRSGMAHISLERNEKNEKFVKELNNKMKKDNYKVITMGEKQITIIFSEENEKIFKSIKSLEFEKNLTLVTIDFPDEMVETMGLMAYILNETRWANVNIRELFSTYTELGILVRENESQALYNAMLRLKK